MCEGDNDGLYDGINLDAEDAPEKLKELFEKAEEMGRLSVSDSINYDTLFYGKFHRGYGDELIPLWTYEEDEDLTSYLVSYAKSESEDDLIAAINDADSWYDEILELLSILAERAGIDPQEYRDKDPADLCYAIEMKTGWEINA